MLNFGLFYLAKKKLSLGGESVRKKNTFFSTSPIFVRVPSGLKQNELGRDLTSKKSEIKYQNAF